MLGMAAGAVAAGIAGCLARTTGDGIVSGTTTDGAGARIADIDPPREHVTVTMRTDAEGPRYDPPIVHIEPGGVVEWVLESGVHDVVAYHPDNATVLPSAVDRRMPSEPVPWASRVLDRPGDRYERRFPIEGIYDYACSVGTESRTRGSGPVERPLGGPRGPGCGADPHGPHGGGLRGQHGGPGWHRPRSDWRRPDGGIRDRIREHVPPEWSEEGDPHPNAGTRDQRWPQEGPGNGRREPRTATTDRSTATGHEARGMVGRVIVGRPDLSTATAMAEPSNRLPAGARDRIRRFNELTRGHLTD